MEMVNMKTNFPENILHISNTLYIKQILVPTIKISHGVNCAWNVQRVPCYEFYERSISQPRSRVAHKTHTQRSVTDDVPISLRALSLILVSKYLSVQYLCRYQCVWFTNKPISELRTRLVKFNTVIFKIGILRLGSNLCFVKSKSISFGSYIIKA